MKYRIFLIVFILFGSSLLALPGNEVKMDLTGVKVFLTGAEIQHFAKYKVDKGVTEIVLKGLASGINRNSINLSAKGDAVIISVVQRFDYLKPAEQNPVVKALEDSLETLNQKLYLKQGELDVLKYEIELLMANKEIGTDSKGVTVTDLQKISEYFRKRFTEIKSSQLSIMNQSKKIEKEVDRIKKQLAELNARLNRPENELIVTVSAKSSTQLDLTLTYLVNEAGWQPVYDIRVDNLNGPVNFNYKANVWQRSGVDWNDVNIILSTRNPVQNNAKPELYPWFIDFQQAALYKDRVGAAQKSLAAAPVAMSSEMQMAESMADYISVDQKQLSVEFNPSLKYSVPSDGKPYTVAIRDYSVSARYTYYAAPKLDDNAFLVAYLTDWNNLNLLPGTANIYFENSFVGESFIDPFTSEDSLKISLGRDQSITVKREVMKDFTEDKFLSSDVERFFGFEIVVRNNKNIPVKILIEDQVPISKNEEIEVKLIDSSGGKYTVKDGKIGWDINIEGSKSLTKKLVYSVRYPNGQKIQGL